MSLKSAEEELAELEAQLNALTKGVPDEAATIEEVKVEPEPEPEPEVVPDEPVKDANYWKAEYEKIEAVKNKRDKDLEKGLHTTLQVKSELEKELEAARAKAAEVDALKAEIERLRLSQTKGGITLEPEFEDAYPDIASQIKYAVAKVQTDAEQRVEELRKLISTQQERLENERKNAAVQEHFLSVQAVHPDASEYFDPTKLGGAIHAWAATKADVVESILSNPANFKPKDVAWVISEFKKETGLAVKPKVKPVTGDLSIKTGHATVVATDTDDDSLTENEIKNYDKMLEKARRTGDTKKLSELERKMENYYLNQFKS